MTQTDNYFQLFGHGFLPARFSVVWHFSDPGPAGADRRAGEPRRGDVGREDVSGHIVTFSVTMVSPFLTRGVRGVVRGRGSRGRGEAGTRG